MPKKLGLLAVTFLHLSVAKKDTATSTEEEELGNCGDECNYDTPYYDPRFAVPNLGSFYDWNEWEKYVLPLLDHQLRRCYSCTSALILLFGRPILLF